MVFILPVDFKSAEEDQYNLSFIRYFQIYKATKEYNIQLTTYGMRLDLVNCSFLSKFLLILRKIATNIK